MVRGRGMAVIAVACTYQWADTMRIARGRGTAWPNARQASVYRFFSRAFIGLPWPKNAAGMTVIADHAQVPAVIITPGGTDRDTPRPVSSSWEESGAAPAAADGPQAPRRPSRHRG